MVEGDEGGGLGHAVALDEGEPDAVPEGFELGGQGGAAGDDGPELPTQGAMHLTEAPPALPDGKALGGIELGGESREAAERMGAEALEGAGDGGADRVVGMGPELCAEVGEGESLKIGSGFSEAVQQVAVGDEELGGDV